MRVKDAPTDWSGINAEVVRRLAETDRYMQPDLPLTESCRQALVAYRQSLRGLNHTYAHPEDVVFPTQPQIEKARA
ncbi:hypothetical protein Sp245p_23535 (plasmid) [Azospirillum baldaniorum]|uniref:Phage tail assembly chaperone-like domain-containing protein n=1 Tax=Azospirillum baldaniorum TaxID=1064539 RepID=A0A9P1NR27_9PROT|nr:tail fiber assembly protein [Azospirillum baldaniorum]AWJ92818.1 hypothetical protein Sp245p_23535 [Azospirillum baldaniorum]TWA78236.1 phage tail assembly chaperone [Azospirillum brasilense]CCD02636.1 protein of unknown function [Azospirillum baldaniorum]